jgi:hypothetical protein
VSIPESVKFIAEAFVNCSSMTKEALQRKLRDMRHRAFKGCFALNQLSAPLGLEYGFQDKGLRKCWFEVEEIRKDTFSGVTKLQRLKLLGDKLPRLRAIST